MRYEILKYERIRNLRIDNDFSQKDIAKIVHVAPNTYCQYELGLVEYPIKVVIPLAQYYHTSVDYLLDLTDEMEPFCPICPEKFSFDRIKALRKENHLNQEVISSAIYVTQNTYSQYETGVLGYPLDIVIALAKYYHTSIDYLLGLTDETKPYPLSKIYRVKKD